GCSEELPAVGFLEGVRAVNFELLAMPLHDEEDLVSVRQRTRQVAALIGFDSQDQTRLGTAASEIARTAFQYGRGGKVSYSVDGEQPPQRLVIDVTDEGPGIANVAEVLQGRCRSRTGTGLGIQGARRLVDQLRIETGGGVRGTKVTMVK